MRWSASTFPTKQQVDAYLPPYDPVQVLDPAEPVSIGAMVGPEAFTEVRFLAHYKQTLALRLIPEFSDEFEKRFGRDSGGLLRTYRADDADMLVVAMGSVCGTIKDTIDEMREDGIRIGLVVIVSFRPFPVDALRNALAGAKDVVVVEKSIAVGMGGQLANNVDVALRNLPRPPRLHSVGRRPWRPADHARLAAPSVPAGQRAALGRHAFPRSERTRRRPRNPSHPQEPALRTDGRKHPAPAGQERSRPAAE